MACMEFLSTTLRSSLSNPACATNLDYLLKEKYSKGPVKFRTTDDNAFPRVKFKTIQILLILLY